MDFEPCFKVYNLDSIRPKSMNLGQMINLNVIFHMMGSVYRLVTIRNSPQFPVEFRNGLLAGWSVLLVKNCGRGLVNATFALRLRAAFSSLRSRFFTLRTDPEPFLQ